MSPSSIVTSASMLLILASASHSKRDVPFKSVGGAFFAVSVPDMAQSVQWYSEKLGLSVTLESPGVPAVTVMEGGGLIVELIHDPSAQPGPARPEQEHGVFKAGFLVKHFDETVEELRRRDVTIAFGPFPPQGGQRANVLIRDNASNLIQIFGEQKGGGHHPARLTEE